MAQPPPPPISPAAATSELVFAGQSRALQLLVSGADLEAVFDALVVALEANMGGAVGAILVLDADGRRLRHGAAPSLPDSYNRAVDGIEIDPEVGTCAAAAARNQIVVTPDIARAPSWDAFKHLPLALGLRAAWSMPIRGANGGVLGTFGTYFRECREPRPAERELVSVLAQTAALALEHRATELALREEEAFLQGVIGASADCIKVLDLEGRLQWMSANGLCAMDVENFDTLRGSRWLEIWSDPTTHAEAAAALQTARGGGLGRFQGAAPTAKRRQKWWDVVVSLIRADDGTGRALLCVSRDITEAKHGQAAQKRSAELKAINLRLRVEIGERRNLERARQTLVRELEGAEEAERRRISRELHDEVGQHLTALILGLRSLRPHLAEPMHDKLRTLESITDTVVKEIHDLALELRPTALDDFGLDQALANYAEGWSASTGIPVEFKRPETSRRFPSPVESTIYRIMQEALTNVAKHAHAKKVGLVIEPCADHVLAVVEDDGSGFDSAVALTAASQRLGLRGMRERVAAHGGTLDVESAPGRGTAVIVRIPVTSYSDP